MGVPAHDDRDFEFAKKFDLSILPVISPDLESHPDLIPDGLTAEDIKVEVLSGKRCWEETGLAINSSHGNFSIDGQNIEEAKK